MRMHRRHIPWILLVVALLVVAGQHWGWLDKTKRAAEQTQPGLYTVIDFVDGDTIAVSMDSHKETIRFIGVDTPETHHPTKPVQCYGPEAADFTKRFIGTNAVRLASDSLSTNRDRYNRLLRYVYLPNGTLVNEQLIEQGYGFYYPYFPFTKSSEFQQAETDAQTNHRGLWNVCKPQPTSDGGYNSNPL